MKKATNTVLEFTANWSGKQVTLNTEGLTKNEVAVMIAVRNNNFSDIYAEDSGQDWSFGVCESSGLSEKVYRGVVSSLIKKGFIIIDGKGSDATLGLTPRGGALYGTVEAPAGPRLFALHAFTGMKIGDFEIHAEHPDRIELRTKKGILVFDKASGRQINGNNPKFANVIKEVK
jgi:predicted transcriptional regulator